MRSMSVLLGALGALATTASGQKLMDNPSPGNFIRRSFAAATVIGDYVYIDGGGISQKLDNKTLPPDQAYTPMNSTLSFNISTSWETSKVNILAYDKPAPAPKLTRQVLWKGEDPKAFWIWGGRTIRDIDSDKINKRKMWRFEANGEGGGRWFPETPNESDDFRDMHLPFRPAYTTYKNTGFSFGGEQVPASDPEIDVKFQPVQGMVTFDLNSKTFSNESTPDVSRYGTLVGATAEYVPGFGDNGLIMILGGYGYTPDTNVRRPDQTLYFDNLTFLDPETRQWYWQKSSGDHPSPRLDHCSVGVRSGRDTHEIFVFGGHDPINEETFEDIYVLSLPGFIWKRIDATSGGPRRGQACVATENRQMISIGGINSNKDNEWRVKDPFPQGLGVFDMTELKWKDNYDHNAAPYDSPKPVREWYASGGLDGVKWSSTQTKALFTSVTPDVPKESKTPTGAIAGGVVGGVVGVCLIGVLVWWLLRRRRRAAGRAVEGEYAAAHTGMDPVRAEMDGTLKRTELPPHEASPPSELAGSDRPLPPELDAPVAELDGSNEAARRIR